MASRVRRWNGSAWVVVLDNDLYAPFSFSNIAVAGQSTVVADGTADTLTLAGGTGVTITTNAGTDTVTLAIGQDVAASASPTFTAVNTSANGVMTVNGTGYFQGSGGNYFRPSDGTNMVIYNGGGTTLLYAPAYAFKNVAGTDLVTFTSGGNVNATGRFRRSGTDGYILIGTATANCTSALTPTTTTMADVTGATLSLTVEVGDIISVRGDFVVAITANNGAVVGEINIAGSTAGSLSSFGAVSSVAPQGGGFTIHYDYTVVSAGTLTVKLRGRMAAGGAASAANANTNTKITALHFR